MSIRACFRVVFVGILLSHGVCVAGMPGPLPSNWTIDRPDHGGGWSLESSADPGWSAVSFFLAILGLSALAVQLLWNFLRRDFPALPLLTYRRAISFVTLWGLLFVIVLTMISGARELMTPGAWRRQGWTYKLAQTSQSANEQTRELRLSRRRQALEQLRTALWQFAATHEGVFPSKTESSIDAKLWTVPDSPGMTYFFVNGLKADSQGRLLVFEPEIDGDERQVLLTNGMIGTMRADEIRRIINESEQP